MENQESQNIHHIDDELKSLKEKREKLEKISSELKHIYEKKDNLDKDISKNDVNSKNITQSVSDTEKLALTKQEILDFCDQVIEKWENDPSKDTRYIFAMNAVKTSILWTEEDTIKEIWKEIFQWAYELLYKNAIAQGNSENLEWSKILGKLKDN